MDRENTRDQPTFNKIIMWSKRMYSFRITHNHLSIIQTFDIVKSLTYLILQLVQIQQNTRARASEDLPMSEQVPAPSNQRNLKIQSPQCQNNQPVQIKMKESRKREQERGLASKTCCKSKNAGRLASYNIIENRRI